MAQLYKKVEDGKVYYYDKRHVGIIKFCIMFNMIKNKITDQSSYFYMILIIYMIFITIEYIYDSKN